MALSLGVSHMKNKVDSKAYNLFSSTENFMLNTNGLGDGISGEEFNRVLAEAKSPLYSGCSKYTKLSAIIALYNLKAKHS